MLVGQSGSFYFGDLIETWGFQVDDPYDLPDRFILSPSNLPNLCFWSRSVLVLIIPATTAATTTTAILPNSRWQFENLGRKS